VSLRAVDSGSAVDGAGTVQRANGHLSAG
jgi:hypothetical protein